MAKGKKNNGNEVEEVETDIVQKLNSYQTEPQQPYVLEEWENFDKFFPNEEAARQAIEDYNSHANMMHGFRKACKDITGIEYPEQLTHDTRGGANFAMFLADNDPKKVAEARKEIFLAHAEGGERYEKFITKVVNKFKTVDPTKYDLNTKQGVYDYITYINAFMCVQNYFDENHYLENQLLDTPKKKIDMQQLNAFQSIAGDYLGRAQKQLVPDSPSFILQASSTSKIDKNTLTLDNLSTLGSCMHVSYDISNAMYNTYKNGSCTMPLHIPGLLAGNGIGNDNNVYGFNQQLKNIDEWLQKIHLMKAPDYRNPDAKPNLLSADDVDPDAITLGVAKSTLFSLTVNTFGTDGSLQSNVNLAMVGNGDDGVENSIYIDDVSLKDTIDEYISENKEADREDVKTAIIAGALANPYTVISQITYGFDESNKKIVPQVAVYNKDYSAVIQAAKNQKDNSFHLEENLQANQDEAVKNFYDDKLNEKVLNSFNKKNKEAIIEANKTVATEVKDIDVKNKDFIARKKLLSYVQTLNTTSGVDYEPQDDESPEQLKFDKIIKKDKLDIVAKKLNDEFEAQNVHQDEPLNGKNVSSAVNKLNLPINLTAEKIDKIIDDAEKGKYEYSFSDEITEMKKIHPDETEKLDYINETFTKTNADNYNIGAFQTELALSQKNDDLTEVIPMREFVEAHPEYADLIQINPHSASLTIKGDEQTIKNLFQEERTYSLSQKTKDGILDVVNKINEFGILEAENVKGEEGIKVYAFDKLYNKGNKVQSHLENDELDEAYNATKEYESIKGKYTTLLDMCDKHFGKNTHVPGNLAVSRNSNIPKEFTSRISANAQLNSIYLLASYCKTNNVDCKDVLNNPKKYLEESYTKLQDKFIDKYDSKIPFTDRLTNLMDVKLSDASISELRGLSTMHVLEQDPEQVKKNAFTACFAKDVSILAGGYGNNGNALFINPDFTVDYTSFKNYLVAGDKRPITDFTPTFINVKTGERFKSTFDYEDFVKNDTRSLKEITNDLSDKIAKVNSNISAMKKAGKKINSPGDYDLSTMAMATSSYLLDVMQERGISINSKEAVYARAFLDDPERYIQGSFKAMHPEANSNSLPKFNNAMNKAKAIKAFGNLEQYKQNVIDESVNCYQNLRAQPVNVLLDKYNECNNPEANDSPYANLVEKASILRSVKETYNSRTIFGKIFRPSAYKERKLIKNLTTDMHNLGINDQEINDYMNDDPQKFGKHIVNRRNKFAIYSVEQEAQNNNVNVEANNDNIVIDNSQKDIVIDTSIKKDSKIATQDDLNKTLNEDINVQNKDKLSKFNKNNKNKTKKIEISND